MTETPGPAKVDEHPHRARVWGGHAIHAAREEAGPWWTHRTACKRVVDAASRGDGLLDPSFPATCAACKKALNPKEN